MKTLIIKSKLALGLSTPIMLAASALMPACGSSSSSGSSTSSDSISSILSGLNQIPSSSSMASTNSSSSSKDQIRGHILAESGTPPAVTSLGSANVDQYFYDGLIAKITSSSWSSEGSSQQQADAASFWGQTDGGASGQGGCNMVAGLAQSFGQLLSNTNSTCYMKGIPSASGGVTISSGTASQVFAQGAKDKLVEVQIKNMTQTNNGQSQTVNMNVFITIPGTKTVTSNVYQAHLYMCGGSSSQAMQDEVITIKKSTGAFTDVSNQSSGGGNSSYSSVSATLKNSSGSIAFDVTQPRIVDSFNNQGQNGIFKSHVEIDGNNSITTKSYSSGSFGSNENYTIADFSGSSLKDLAFLQGGFAGYTNCANCPSGNQTNTFKGGVEYRNTFYAAAPSNSLATQVASENFSSDSYFQSLTPPSFDFTQDNCSATPNITVTADFSNAALVAVQNTCEGDTNMLTSDIWDMCQIDSINTAMQDIMQIYQGQ